MLVSIFISDRQANAVRSSQSDMHCEKAVHKKFAKFTENTCTTTAFLINFLISCLRGCFPVNFEKFLRKYLFFIEYLWWLRLCCYESLQCLWLYQQQVHIWHAILLSLSSPQVVKKGDLGLSFSNALFLNFSTFYNKYKLSFAAYLQSML